MTSRRCRADHSPIRVPTHQCGLRSLPRAHHKHRRTHVCCATARRLDDGGTPIGAIERALAEVIKNHWPVYVIEHDGQIVGSAEAYPESFCRPGGSEVIVVLGMQVKREYRRHGYGSALLTAVIEHCRAAGFISVDLSVFESNTAARSLYDKLGFILAEHLPPCELPCGATEQPIKMRLGLGAGG